jgi:PAS domain S-box-containing protein
LRSFNRRANVSRTCSFLLLANQRRGFLPGTGMRFSTDFVPVLSTPLRKVSRYLIGLAVVVAATLLRLAADPILGDQVPYFVYVGASVVATWVAGVEGGIVATVVATFAGNYFFVPPRHDIGFTLADSGAMATFAAFSSGLVWLVGRWRAAERRVRELHARTADVLNQMPIAVVLAEPPGRALFHNLATTRLFGRPLTASIDIRDYRDYFTYHAYRPDGTPLDPTDSPLVRALRGETVTAQEAEIVHTDGARRTLSICAAPIRDAEGRIASAVATFWDVTDQKLAGDALRERAEELQKVLDAVPAAVFVTRDTDASRMEGNRFAAEYLRVPFGSNLSKTAPASEAATSFRAMKDGKELSGEELPVQRAIVQGEEVRDYEFDLVYRDGNSRTVFGNATPLRDEDGRVRGAIGAFVDVTERKHVEEALRTSEQRYRRLFDNMNEIMAVDELLYDADGHAIDWRILDVNPEYSRTSGRSREEVVGRSLKELYGEPPSGAFVSRFAGVVETGEPVQFEEYFAPLRMHMSTSAFHLGGRRFATLTTDVTERYRMELRLREQADALEHANRVKDEFLATLSHELRTPLNAILGWSDMLLRPELPPEMQRKALESVNRNARAQAALISDILDVSRIITGKLRLDLRSVDFRDVVRASCESIQPAADAKGVEIRIAIHPHPAVAGDPDRLQQVLWNLLSNSVKFSERGGRIELDVRQVGSNIRIVVKDEGAGIAPDLLPHVFERFRQADSSTTRTRGGLGLGLAIVRHLVELHGGTVTAESAGPGRGARFAVTLPARSLVVADRLPADSSMGTPWGSVAILEGSHILAVDDQEEARVLIQAVLERHGARVTVCSTAEEALSILSRERPDMLVADVGMPGVDGYELIRRVRALPDRYAKMLPAVALTAYGGVPDRAKALAAGYWEHLAKPIMPDALATALAAVLGRHADGR